MSEQLQDHLSELPRSTFISAEINSWLTTPDEKLIATQAPYILSGDITGELPVRYAAPLLIEKTGRWTEKDAYDKDPLFQLLGIRYRMTESMPEAVGSSSDDIHAARYNYDAFSDITRLFLAEPNSRSLLPEHVSITASGVSQDERFELRIRLLFAHIDRYERNAADVESRAQSKQSEVLAKRLARTCFASDPATIGGPIETPLKHSKNNRMYWVNRLNYEGTLGGGTPKNPLRIGKR